MSSSHTLSAQVIVFLHPFPLSHVFWDQVGPIAGYRFVKPDFPGFGGSALEPDGFTLTEAAIKLKYQLRDLGIDKPVVLVGISMGGYWALEYCRQFPDLVHRLVLISTRAGTDKPEGRQNRLKMAQRVEKEGVHFLAEAMIPGLLGKTTLADKPEIKTRLVNWISQTSPQAVALAQRAMANRLDQTDFLSQIKTKTLILAGREDTLIPATEAQAMGQRIANHQILLVEQVGHLIPLESPQWFQKALEEFLGS